MLKKSKVLAPLVIALIALSGCGTTSSTPTRSEVPLTKLSVPVPAEIAAAKKLTVGVACDYPPFGFQNIDNKNAGYDTDVARELARYAFGSSDAVAFTCVTPANRIPYLQTKKIDLIISTLGYTAERAKTIDYSMPYFTSGAKLLVPSASSISGWPDIKGKPVITKQGTTSSTYLQQCFPDSHQLLLNSTSDAVTALKQGRGTAFIEDSTLLLGLSLTDKTVKVVGDDEATTPWGIGIRQGDSGLKTWVDAALTDMKAHDTFYTIFKQNIKDEQAQKAFGKAMPRPDVDIKYSADTSFTCMP